MAVGLDRRFVGGVGDRPRAVALVEFEPVGVVGPDLGVGAKRRVVGQAFEIELGAERPGLLPHPLIERRADPTAHAAGRGRDQLEIGEADIGRVQQERQPSVWSRAFSATNSRDTKRCLSGLPSC